ncbi:hypothetical protein AC578_10917 [Pseudocercospora eumusae]|uniref:Uncharacterized protein n=1 Tax=Pseudocercospora eumusae TaxID=321146 RepID=A0A139HFB9_9PEZI|nr:hypothetical protein AC578_10917 [Pseudocercospora eumusae]
MWYERSSLSSFHVSTDFQFETFQLSLIQFRERSLEYLINRLQLLNEGKLARTNSCLEPQHVRMGTGQELHLRGSDGVVLEHAQLLNEVVDAFALAYQRIDMGNPTVADYLEEILVF